MYRSAVFEEPLLRDLHGDPASLPRKCKSLPKDLQRSNPVVLPNIDETQVVRHFHLQRLMRRSAGGTLLPIFTRIRMLL